MPVKISEYSNCRTFYEVSPDRFCSRTTILPLLSERLHSFAKTCNFYRVVKAIFWSKTTKLIKTVTMVFVTMKYRSNSYQDSLVDYPMLFIPILIKAYENCPASLKPRFPFWISCPCSLYRPKVCFRHPCLWKCFSIAKPITRPASLVPEMLLRSRRACWLNSTSHVKYYEIWPMEFPSSIYTAFEIPASSYTLIYSVSVQGILAMKRIQDGAGMVFEIISRPAVVAWPFRSSIWVLRSSLLAGSTIP